MNEHDLTGESVSALVERFASEASAAGAGTSRVSSKRLAARISELLGKAKAVFVTAQLPGVAEALRALGVLVLTDDNESPGADRRQAASSGDSLSDLLAHADGGVTSALAAIASSGTVVLEPASESEAMAMILPPHHVVVVSSRDVYPDLSATLKQKASLMGRPESRVVFVTGPSRTSDIELTPVIGVHGPLRLDIVIVDEQ